MSIDVAVVGGGPSGLFAALGLLKAFDGLKVKVFERAKSYRECGAGITLDVNGMKALRAVDPDLYSRFQNAVVTDVNTMQTFDQHGEPISEPAKMSMKEIIKKVKEATGVGFGMIGWFDIQQMIFEALPEGTVEFGHAFTDYQEDENGVSIGFKDKAAVRARYLVGADGYFSPVREALLHDGPPEFTETVMWRARFPWRPDAGLPKGPEYVHAYQGGFMQGLVYGLPGDMVCWILSASVETCKQQGVEYDAEAKTRSQQRRQISSYQNADEGQGASAYERCMKLAENAAPQMQELVRRTDPSAIIEHGLFVRQAHELDKYAETGWGKGRVTLIGDAAHPMRPTGQGMNTALEDGAVLAWHLQHGGLSAESMRAFEKERLPRVQKMAEQEYARGATAYRENAKDAVERARTLPMSEQEFNTFKRSWEPQRLTSPVACSVYRNPPSHGSQLSLSSHSLSSHRLSQNVGYFHRSRCGRLNGLGSTHRQPQSSMAAMTHPQRSSRVAIPSVMSGRSLPGVKMPSHASRAGMHRVCMATRAPRCLHL